MRAQIVALLEEENCAKQVLHSLSTHGYQVLRCKTFSEAIKILQGPTADSISLILSDVHLENGGNVFDFLRWVRSHATLSDVPFVLFSPEPSLTAKYLEDGLRTSARLLGATGYISMNAFDEGELWQQLGTFLPKRKNLVDLPTDSLKE